MTTLYVALEWYAHNLKVDKAACCDSYVSFKDAHVNLNDTKTCFKDKRIVRTKRNFTELSITGRE